MRRQHFVDQGRGGGRPRAGEGDAEDVGAGVEGREDEAAHLEIIAVDREAGAGRVDAEAVRRGGSRLADDEARPGIVAIAAVERVEIDVAERDPGDGDRRLLGRVRVGQGRRHVRLVVDRIDVDGQRVGAEVGVIGLAAVVDHLEGDRAGAGAVEIGVGLEGDQVRAEVGGGDRRREGGDLRPALTNSLPPVTLLTCTSSRASPASTSVKPKSAAARMSVPSSSTDSVSSVPAGASLMALIAEAERVRARSRC